MRTPSRPVLAQPALYAYLIAAFDKARPAQCHSCRFPLPFWGPGVGMSSGYWFMPSPAACPNDCHRVIAELWARVTTEYELASPPRLLEIPYRSPRERSVA